MNLSMSEKKKYLKVGSYTPPNGDGNGGKIAREFYRQGVIFKNDEAFYDTEHPDRVCYIPELSDSTYTRTSFLEICNNQTELAEELYEAVDWQHPETLLEDWFRNGEVDTCKKCGKMFDCYEETKCPHCGAAYEDDNGG